MVKLPLDATWPYSPRSLHAVSAWEHNASASVPAGVPLHSILATVPVPAYDVVLLLLFASEAAAAAYYTGAAPAASAAAAATGGSGLAVR